jgi:aspartyl-tRNA(Asn)/glutamyl-tRNA(Gln) amidotransferase subunit B
MSNYIPSIGMEVHAELQTHSKMFCRCPVAFGGEPNSRVCPVCIGLPGTLPVPNKAAIEMVIKTALALNCKVAMRSVFHRKNYFYPDLPKGYQVSQYGETNPLGYHGYLDIPTKNGGTKRIRIRRVHLEEDTGKLMHLPSGGSGVDYNRAGVPLMEIVTDFPPDIADADEAAEYLKQLRQILIYLGVCDGKMEEGSLRCEPNISVRLDSQETLGTKTELKNLNSFKSVQLGSAFEIRRQVATLEHGGSVAQETRGWNEEKGVSYLMRTKESENDYRYFPCPDLVPMAFTEADIERLRAELPELPLAKFNRYMTDLGLSAYDAGVLTSDRSWAAWFEVAVRIGGDPKTVCNWMNSDFAKLLNDEGIEARESKISPTHLVDLTKLLGEGTISGKTAKDVFAEAYRTGKTPSDIVKEKGATQISDESAIADVVKKVLGESEDVVAKYKAGNAGVKGFLVGQVMKQTGGRANPQIVQRLVQEALDQ